MPSGSVPANLFPMFLPLQRRTASSTAALTKAGESMLNSKVVPSSVSTLRGPSTVHPRRLAVATYAAAGPQTVAHGFLARAKRALASAMSLPREAQGNHSYQTDIAQKTMGWQCASNAGSARPRILPSAMASVRSRSPPPTVRTLIAATALRCWRSSLLETPVTACPKVRAAIPPVRIKRGMSTPAFRSRLKRRIRARKLSSRACATFVFRLLPAPRADPREVTRGAKRSFSPGTAPTSERPMRMEEALQTHLVPDSCMRSCAMTDTRKRRTETIISTMSRSRAVASMVISSTNTVSSARGLSLHA